jgi:hypothetical protein
MKCIAIGVKKKEREMKIDCLNTPQPPRATISLMRLSSVYNITQFCNEAFEASQRKMRYRLPFFLDV